MGYSTAGTYARTYYPSDDIIVSSDSSQSQNAAVPTWAKLKQITIGADIGFYSYLRYKFHLSSGVGGTVVHGQIYRNGVAVGTDQSTALVLGIDTTEDINTTGWMIGDTIELWAESGAAWCAATVTNFRLCGVSSEFVNTIGY